jgi:hypothetical protein
MRDDVYSMELSYKDGGFCPESKKARFDIG